MKLIIAAMLITISTAATAQVTPEDQRAVTNSPGYYSIGGPLTVIARPPTGKPTIRRELTTDINFNYQCGEFDIIEDLERRFEQFADGLDNAADLMVIYIEGQIANIPIYLLQRWFPGAYETAQEFFDRYWAEYQIYLEQCNSTKERILKNGGGLFENFGVWAKAGKWQAGIGNAQTASETGETISEAYLSGAPWVTGDNRGGVGQEPAKYVADLCRLGYTILTEGDNEAYIKTYFESAEDLVIWCNNALGEIEVSLVSNPKNTPGRGMWAMANEKSEEVQILIDKIATQGATSADYDLLYELTKGAIPIDRATIEAAVKTNKRDSSIKLRLAFLAQQSTNLKEMQRAMMVMRALRAAGSDPVAISSGATDAITNTLIPMLREEMEMTQQLFAHSKTISESIHNNIMTPTYKTPTGRINQNRPIGGTRDGDVGGSGGNDELIEQ